MRGGAGVAPGPGSAAREPACSGGVAGLWCSRVKRHGSEGRGGAETAAAACMPEQQAASDGSGCGCDSSSKIVLPAEQPGLSLSALGLQQ